MPLRGLVGLLLLATVSLKAQTVTLKFVDGRSGESLKALHLSVFGGELGSLPVTASGDTYVVDTKGAEVLQIDGPSLKLSYGSEYSLCDKDRSQVLQIKVQQVLQTGFVTQSSCTLKQSATARPGVALFYMRKTHWWERLD